MDRLSTSQLCSGEKWAWPPKWRLYGLNKYSNSVFVVEYDKIIQEEQNKPKVKITTSFKAKKTMENSTILNFFLKKSYFDFFDNNFLIFCHVLTTKVPNFSKKYDL